VSLNRHIIEKAIAKDYERHLALVLNIHLRLLPSSICMVRRRKTKNCVVKSHNDVSHITFVWWRNSLCIASSLGPVLGWVEDEQ
jgi:hypothetical protein